MSFGLLSKISNTLKFNSTLLLNKSKIILPVLYNFHSEVQKPVQLNELAERSENDVTKNILQKVNETQLISPSRTFAVVHVCGKQFKITTDDVIIIEGYWPPDVGDKIRLEKVLCAGGENFSLIGTPLVQSGLVNVYATVIEKNLSHTKTHFRKKRRKQYTNINFYRMERTMLRINEIGIGQVKDD